MPNKKQREAIYQLKALESLPVGMLHKNTANWLLRHDFIREHRGYYKLTAHANAWLKDYTEFLRR